MFRGRRVQNIGQVDIDQYVVTRSAQGAKGSTIRRELGTLTKTLLAAKVERVEALQRCLGRIIPALFPHDGQGQRAGQPRRDLRKAWGSACKEAGVSGRFRHDLRRTTVRYLVNAGVPERLTMMITGHKTRSVFDRYQIVSPADLQEAARRLTGTIQAQRPVPAVDTPHVTS